MNAPSEEAQYYIRDPRQKSLYGKPDGGWLKQPPAPAIWVRSREQARTFTQAEIEALKTAWPYFDGCELVQVQS